MKKYRNIILALSVVLLLNSCLVSTAVGTVAGAAVEVVKLPFKLIGGIINIINGSNRDKEIEKVGMSKYEKKVSEILERKKETLTFGNFSVYIGLNFIRIIAHHRFLLAQKLTFTTIKFYRIRRH